MVVGFRQGINNHSRHQLGIFFEDPTPNSICKHELWNQSCIRPVLCHSEFWESDRAVESPWVDGEIVVPLEVQAGMH